MTYLTDIFKDELVPKVNSDLGTAVYFDAGHYKELTARIDKKKNNVNLQRVYPLIWLVMDFSQEETQIGYNVPRARLFIVEKSDGYTSSLERIEKVFKPLLVPIWESLRNAIQISYSFDNPLLECTVTLHPYAEGLGKAGNLFNDTVDCIEVSNLSLVVKNKIC